MKIKIIIILFLICFAAPSIARQQGPALVKVAIAKKTMAARSSDMIGTLYFERTSRVSPEEAARITRVGFREGDRVKKGEELIRLDSQILKTELALQKARVTQVEIRMEKTKLNLDRYTHLFKNSAASESAYDDLRLSYAELQQERIALSRQVEILSIRMAKHVVKAPFDGIILAKLAEVGEWVQPGAALCVLGAADALYVQVPVAEHLVGFSKKGDQVPVILNAFGKQITGIVEGLRPKADPKTKNVSLKIRLPYNGPVAENMSATVKVPVSSKEPAIMIPRDALVQVRGKDMVFTIKENKAEGTPVKIVHSKGRNLGVVSESLKPGMVVVTEGNERLNPGQPVTIQGEDK